MKTILSRFSFLFLLLFTICTAYSNTNHGDLSAVLCPDPPSNDDPCLTSVNPPHDLTGGGTHLGSTCCARGPQDSNTDGSPADHPNFACSSATEGAAVWYVFVPNDADAGYDITLEEVGGANQAEGPITVEVYWANEEDACMGNLIEPLASSCVATTTTIKIGNCPAQIKCFLLKLVQLVPMITVVIFL